MRTHRTRKDEPSAKKDEPSALTLTQKPRPMNTILLMKIEYEYNCGFLIVYNFHYYRIAWFRRA